MIRFKQLLLAALLALLSVSASAEVHTWKYVCDKIRSNGGEGFWYTKNSSKTELTETLNTLSWTAKSSEIIPYGYTATTGQMIGTATTQCDHVEFSTDGLSGRKILKIEVEANTKDTTTLVTISAGVNGKSYLSKVGTKSDTLTSKNATYTFVPEVDAEEGTIAFAFDVISEKKGAYYYKSITITYDGEPLPRKEAELSFVYTEVKVEAGDNANGPSLRNPHNVSPIKYKAEDEKVAYIGTSGGIFSIAEGETHVYAIFAGNDEYLPDTASYLLKVLPKPVILAPTVDIPGCAFTEPLTVTISSTDELCQAIWYSLSAKDSVEMTDSPTIVAGNTATITIDRGCTLICCAVGDNNIGCVRTETYINQMPLKAAFNADEEAFTYYSMGWDDLEEASTWKYYGINDDCPWGLRNAPNLKNAVAFSTIDAKSKYSLHINYSDAEQKERAVSPAIKVLPDSKVNFWACFDGVWLVYADWGLIVHDKTTQQDSVLLDAFNWAQANAFTGPSWVNFEFDLSFVAGDSCTFEFIYAGKYGDAVAIDGFTLKQKNTSEIAFATILEGSQVHFHDLSTGEPDSIRWIFTGGDIQESTEAEPIVTYAEAGEYDVTLIAFKGTEADTLARQKYVVVKVMTPTAHIGIPDIAYLSPWAYAFLPVGVPVTFQDLSTGNPTAWLWSFEGTDIATSTLQNPTVTYTTPGLYGMRMKAENVAGESEDFLVNAIQAGGSLDVWNIEPEETTTLDEVSMGWFGIYAGTNSAGMEAFAEAFHKPAVPASIDTVTVYFASAIADSTEALITVAIQLADTAGMPGDTLASASLPIFALQTDKEMAVPTHFVFDKAAEVSDAFFITISGMNTGGYSDDVSVLCAYRGEGGRTSTYHRIANEDNIDGQYVTNGTYTWYKNVDEPLSMAITAHLTYSDKVDALPVIRENGQVLIEAPAYRLNGQRTETQAKGLTVTRQGVRFVK